MVFPGDLPSGWGLTELQPALDVVRTTHTTHLHDKNTEAGKSEDLLMLASAKKRIDNVRAWISKAFQHNIHIDDKLQTAESWDPTWRQIFCEFSVSLLQCLL